jgi:hypothetical protein
MPGPLPITRSTEVVPERQQPDCGHTMVLTYHRHPDPHLYLMQYLHTTSFPIPRGTALHQSGRPARSVHVGGEAPMSTAPETAENVRKEISRSVRV